MIYWHYGTVISSKLPDISYMSEIRPARWIRTLAGETWHGRQ